KDRRQGEPHPIHRKTPTSASGHARTYRLATDRQSLFWREHVAASPCYVPMERGRDCTGMADEYRKPRHGTPAPKPDNAAVSLSAIASHQLVGIHRACKDIGALPLHVSWSATHAASSHALSPNWASRHTKVFRARHTGTTSIPECSN